MVFMHSSIPPFVSRDAHLASIYGGLNMYQAVTARPGDSPAMREFTALWGGHPGLWPF